MYIGVGIVMVRRKRFGFGCMTHAACYLPLPQVAVKALRFRFDGDPNDRFDKVTHFIHNQQVRMRFNCLVDAPSRARDLEETISHQCRSVPRHCTWVWNAWRTVLGVIMDAQRIPPPFLSEAPR